MKRWTLKQLKERVYRSWIRLHVLQECFISPSGPTTDPTFKQEIRTYGDLRKLSSWRAAFATINAKLLADIEDDSQELIELYLIKCPAREGWSDLATSVVEQLLMIPKGFESLAEGLITIAREGCSYGTTLEQVERLFSENQRRQLIEYYQAQQTSESRRCLPTAV